MPFDDSGQLVEEKGIEPSLSCLQGRCITLMLLPRMVFPNRVERFTPACQAGILPMDQGNIGTAIARTSSHIQLAIWMSPTLPEPLVSPRGVEPRSEDFQSPAMTALAQATYLGGPYGT